MTSLSLGADNARLRWQVNSTDAHISAHAGTAMQVAGREEATTACQNTRLLIVWSPATEHHRHRGTMMETLFTAWDPMIAARDSCDSYVVKVPVEVATMLSASQAARWLISKAEGSSGGRSSQTMTVGTSLGVAGHPWMPWNSAA